jgi:hypothetical protein
MEVQVTIGEAGYVKDTQPVLGAGKATGVLLNAAIAAAGNGFSNPPLFTERLS